MAHRNGARDKRRRRERSRAQERLEREMRMVIDVGLALSRAGVYDVPPRFGWRVRLQLGRSLGLIERLRAS